MRVGMVSYSFYECDNRVRRYAETLARRGDHVDVIALHQPGQPNEEVISGVHVFRIQTRVRNESGPLIYLYRLMLFFFRSMFILSEKHFRWHYDLVHVHSMPDFLVFTAWFPLLTGAKVILDIHDLLPEFYASKFDAPMNSILIRLLFLEERISVWFADYIIAANDIWGRRLQSRCRKDGKCISILNYPDRNIFHSNGRVRTDARFRILYPGSLSIHQGVDIAIRAMARIGTSECGPDFHIYGTGDQKPALEKLAAELGLQDRVHFFEPLSITEIVSVMENADLGIVPKRNDTFGDEAFSTKTLEFMAMGVPVIVSGTTIDRHYFNDSVVKFFRSGDERDLADAIVRLMNDAVGREKLIQNANIFIAHNNWDVKKPMYLDLVSTLTAPQIAGQPHLTQ